MGVSGKFDIHTEHAQQLQNLLVGKLDEMCPTKTMRITAQDKPFINHELKTLDRRKQREYRKGKKSASYLKSKQIFEEKKLNEARKYQEKIYKEVAEGKRNSAYRAIRKLGNQPGEGGQKDIVLPAYVKEGLSPQQSADRLADHFSAISMTVDPLNKEQFHPALRLVLEEGLISDTSLS